MIYTEPKNILNNLNFKDLNKEKCIIFGNGPSLKQVDFKLLKQENIPTFTTNRIATICKKEDWNPTFYVAFFCEPFRGENIILPTGNRLQYPGCREQALKTREDIKYLCYNENTTCFVHYWYQYFLDLNKVKNTYFAKPIQWNRFVELPKDIFERLEKGQFLWHSATTQLFQLAFWLNIKNIGIIGQDGFDTNLKINHYDGYTGTEQNIKKFDFANNRMKTLHKAIKNYVVNNNLNSYNISNKTVISNYHKKATFENFLKIK